MTSIDPSRVTERNHTSVAESDNTHSLLTETARRLALTHRAVRTTRERISVDQRLEELSEWLETAQQRFAASDEENGIPSGAAEWMLDNFYIVEQSLRQIKQNLPDTYYTQLPKIDDASVEVGGIGMQGFARVYALAHAYLAHESHTLLAQRLDRFVQAYQQVSPLTMGEVWALPSMLRLALVESLAGAAGRMVNLFDAPPIPIPVLDNMSDEGIIAHTIPSLHATENQNWKEFVEDVSLVHQELSRDPARTYQAMDFTTRDYYRDVVEQLALATGMDEIEVAKEALRLAEESCRVHIERDGHAAEVGPFAADARPRECHVGYYLLDDGRARLEKAIGYQATGMTRVRRWLRQRPAGVYLGGTAAVTLAFMGVALWYAAVSGGGPLALGLVALLTLIPFSNLALDLVQGILTRILPPNVLPKLDFSEGVRAGCRTIVVIPALISRTEDVESLRQQLELHYLRSSDGVMSTEKEDKAPRAQILFALLTDFEDAAHETMPHDDELLDSAVVAIEALNAKYPGQPFYLFHRRRVWNEAEDVWMGWERKRGKLHEFNRLLRGDGTTTYAVQVGELDALSAVRFVISLDADTVLPRGEAQRLIGAMAHPLNRPEFDDRGKVSAGYTVLQPRTEIILSNSNKTFYSSVFSGDSHFDLYTLAVSDIYQDLFGEGIFVGKGIYDVDAFERSLEGRVPDNSILSHDLFEGIHGRAGLVTDVVLYEDYPTHYLAGISRLNRWVRGDWQLLPWLFPKVPYQDEAIGITKIANDLCPIDRWKILDNLRRSLFPPTILALLVAGWTVLPGAPWVWTLLAMLAPASSLLTAIISGLVRLFQAENARRISRNVANQSLRWLSFIVFLPYETLVLLDGIATTLVRLYIRRRRLLQWETAARTMRRFGEEATAQVTFRIMLPSVISAVGIGLLVVLVRPTALAVAAPFLIAWMLAWWVAYRISRPEEVRVDRLSAEQTKAMRVLARRTWLFYEHFVGPDDHWLAPDHFQETPRNVVAHRTSPTNTGMYLLSALAAYDFGYIGPLDLGARLQATVETLHRLDRYRGHFLNWIDTRNLKPLPPRYVSTVDSGNLAGALVALRQGCLELPHRPVWDWERWQGLLDLLPCLADPVMRVISDEDNALVGYLAEIERQILAVRDEPARWHELLQTLRRTAPVTINEHLKILLADESFDDAETLHTIRIFVDRIQHHLEDMSRDVATLLPWLELLGQPPEVIDRVEIYPRLAQPWSTLQDELAVEASLASIPDISEAAGQHLARLKSALLLDSEGDQIDAAYEWCLQMEAALDDSVSAALVQRDIFAKLAQSMEDLLSEMDFAFLFSKQRQVFHIGYNVDAGQFDNSYYDLLASESRIASLVAIGKHDVSQSHWLHLGRPLTQLDSGELTLLSWSGTMFEYLMPPLIVRDYRGTLLDRSCRATVQRQIDVGREYGTPWGISESGYYAFDAIMNYQYRAFGVPSLGFKRHSDEDSRVIAPYASLLAISYNPQKVAQNVEALEALGAQGRYGLYEAVDFTSARLKLGQEYAIVRSFMAHHQGMILVALLNHLHGDRMIDRFHSDPRIQSIELLLQEGVPAETPLQFPLEEQGPRTPAAAAARSINPWHVELDSPMPLVHYLSNGEYSVLITNAGGGYSRWNDVQLTRWRPDTTLDDWGSWLYVEELEGDNGEQSLWSAQRQPTGVRAEHEETLYHPHMAEFRRRYRDIALHTEVTVAPTDPVEIRRITLSNDTDHKRRLRLTSYAEVVLGSSELDLRHQAFSKLFVESEYISQKNALLFHRRPRSASEEANYLAHALVMESSPTLDGAFESDRARFIGRNGSVRRPQALAGKEGWLSGTAGATLDPIMALGQEIELEPHTTIRLALVTLTAKTRERALTLVDRYRRWNTLDRTIGNARNVAHGEVRELGLTEWRLETVQKLLSLLIYPHAVKRAGAETLAANRLGQSGLWAYGISGDNPILLVRIDDENQRELLQEVLQGHRYWLRRGLQIDIVVLNEQDTNYGQPVQNLIRRTVRRMHGFESLNQRGGLFLLRADQMNHDERVLLETSARVALDGAKGSIGEQLKGMLAQPARLPVMEPAFDHASADGEGTGAQEVARPKDLQFDNGYGGFSSDGSEYVIYLRPSEATPAPWINVIANEDFGCLVSETGGGYTWAINSGENRLTTWHNDPVVDQPAEVLYLRDEQTTDVWTPTPQPSPAHAPYLIRHGAGYSVFEHDSHGLKQTMSVFVAADAPVKVVHLRLENLTNRQRRITATYYAEWVLGPNRSQSSQFVVPEYSEEGRALLARNRYAASFSERVAFLAGSQEPHGLTTDRTEFLGRLGSLARPAALERIGLSGRVVAGADPCAALQLHVDLPPGGVEEVYFLVGQGASREDADALVEQFQSQARVDLAWDEAGARWNDILGVLTVETPDAALNLLLNRWLLYQALSCRIWGRSALYQSSGAYGFRDQLQDVMALTTAQPGIAREQILRAARHQFEAGDVLHWWHPPSGNGVRTRVTDDLLWLPYVTAHYVRTTGDAEIFNEEIPFLRGESLSDEEEERYAHYEATEQSFSLYEHCVRALQKATTAGPHGIPLIGSGDWNDGMNRVGIEGRGESIWLGWFLHATLTDFASLAEEHLQDGEQADVWRNQAQDIAQAIEENGWDGQWYLRAYYDDGTPLGSTQNRECRIDSIAQSWAVLSGAADAGRARQGMQSVLEHLVRWEERLILLFAPAFDETPKDPGYIKGYLPGIRENGGQYTHAALWSIFAFAELGDADLADRLFQLINPILRTDTRAKAERYKVEPYVISADVYGVAPHQGRGGWTWYTGSAAWMYRLGVEAILGLRKMPGALRIDPCIPDDWTGYEATVRIEGTTYHIAVQKDADSEGSNTQVTLDDSVLADGVIPLHADGQEHRVVVRIPAEAPEKMPD